MGTEDVLIREQALPGIGRRFDLDVEESLTLIVVVRHDGSRDVGVSEKNADKPRRSVHLGREQAVAVGSLLLGARFSEESGGTGGSALDIGTVVLGDGSPAVNRIPTEIPLPDASDAAVVAVARDDTVQLLEDDRHRPCQPGDRLVVAARRDHLHDVIRHLAG